MIAPNALFLFSTNSWLSFVIAEEYYDSKHYVWTSPLFDASLTGSLTIATPPTSTPKDIYLSLLQEVSRGDRHSSKIAEQRDGIVRGAESMRQKSVISDKALTEIKEVVSLAEIWDFRPLIYVISYPLVKHLVRTVAVRERAHPLSEEYVIEALPRSCFEPITLA